MGGFKHLVIVKFKEGTEVEEIMKGIEKLVADIDIIKAFEWGKDLEGPEMLTQGYTHSFTMTFENKEEYTEFQNHPKHVEYSSTFSAVIDKIVVLTFPSVQLKPPPSPSPPPAAPADEAQADAA